MLAIVLALGAGLGWGTSDFLGGLKSRTAPLLTVLLISQAVALTLLTVIVTVNGTPLPDPSSLGYAAVAGVSETIGIAALYRGLAVGKMGIVAPVAALAPVVPLLAGLMGGEVPGTLQFAGLGLALLGLVITSLRTGENGEQGARPVSSIVFGLLAAGGFGTYFLTMDTASDGDVGWALLAARVTATGLTAAVLLLRRQRLGANRSDLPVIALIGVFMVMGDSLYAIASTQGMVGIVAVLGSLHTVVTMLLARFILNERLAAAQRIGIGTSLLGVLAISAG